MIKRTAIIVLCFVIALEALFPDINLADLAEVPELVSHFSKHRRECPDLSFVEFLALHYENSKHFSATPAEHQKLPFSKRQTNRIPFQMFAEVSAVVPTSSFFFLMDIINSPQPSGSIFTGESNVWQPPKA